MKASEYLEFAGRPYQIGGITRATIVDAPMLNQKFNFDKGTVTPYPGNPAKEWNEAVIAERLHTHPGTENLLIVNMEGISAITYMQSDGEIGKNISELAEWLRMMRRLKQPAARLAIDLSTITGWTLDATWRHANAGDCWRKMKMISRRLRDDVFPLVDAIAGQMYYVIRWNDPLKDLFGEGGGGSFIGGNFNRWETNQCAMSALTDLPTIAIFSPEVMGIGEGRALNDWEMAQSMFFLAGLGYDEIHFWGSVGMKTGGEWNKWDAKADWLPRMMKYWDKNGVFVPDPQWNLS